MSDQPGTLEKLAMLLGSILTRASARLGDDELSDTLATLGIVFPPALLQLPAVTSVRNTIVTAANDLPNAIAQLVTAGEGGDLTAIVQRRSRRFRRPSTASARRSRESPTQSSTTSRTTSPASCSIC